MNLFNRFWFQRKESNVLPIVVMGQVGREQRPEKDFAALATEGYKKNVIAFRCIQIISDAISRLPVCLYRSTTEGAEEVLSHPFLDLLRNPNPFASRIEFLYSLSAYWHISGNGFVEVVSGTKGPMFLYSHRPSLFEIKPQPNGYPGEYVLNVGGKKRSFPVDVVGRCDIAHLKFFNPLNYWFGMSPLEAAAFDLDQVNEANEWNFNLLRNSARPSGALKVKQDEYNRGTLTPEQRHTLKTMLQDVYQGRKNAGRPMVLEGNLDWIEMSLSPKDMDFLANKKVAQKDVAQAFGVPPQLVGIEGSQTFANYEQARESLYEETVIPRAKMILGMLERSILSRYQNAAGLYLDIDTDAIEALSGKREKLWTRAQTAAFLSTNEKRELVGYGKYDETLEEAADKILVGMGQVPLEQAAFAEMGSGEDASDYEDEPEDGEPQDDPDQDPEDSEDDEDNEDSELSAGFGFEAKGLGFFQSGNQTARLRSWRSQMKIQESLERRFASELSRAFAKEYKAALSVVREANGDADRIESGVDRVLRSSAPTFLKILEANMQRAARAFGPAVISEGQKAFPVVPETKAAKDVWEESMRRFIANQAGLKITRLQGTTRKRVLGALRRAMRDQQETGDPNRAIESALRKTYKAFSVARAATIARTETHAAATQATMKAAEALKIPGVKKIWVAAKDERTRIQHASMNDYDAIALDEKFLVENPNGSPDEMDGPGDQSAPAEQVINCRCVLRFRTDD